MAWYLTCASVMTVAAFSAGAAWGLASWWAR